MTDLIRHASAAQAYASDPAASMFVSANAGTGKTKLLTDRFWLGRLPTAFYALPTPARPRQKCVIV